MRKKLTNNMKSYYELLALTILTLFTILIRKVVDDSLKD